MASVKCNKQNFTCFEDLPLGAAFVRFEDIRKQNTDNVYVKVSKTDAVIVSGNYEYAYSQHAKMFVFPCRVTAVEIS